MWFDAAAHADHAAAACELAEILELRQLQASSVTHWYQKAAELGSGRAMPKLGDKAGGAERQDWYRRAADAGDVDALARLADHDYSYGSRDEAEAQRRWLEAVDLGSADAMWSLCNYALNHHDEAGRRDWERRAAEAGNLTALKVMLRNAHGDEEEARWKARIAAALPCDPPAEGPGGFGGLFDLALGVAFGN